MPTEGPVSCYVGLEGPGGTREMLGSGTAVSAGVLLRELKKACYFRPFLSQGLVLNVVREREITLSIFDVCTSVL